MIEYDEIAQAPFFHYKDNEGREHIVWFEDARSIKAKFQLVKRLNLRGIAYWNAQIERDPKTLESLEKLDARAGEDQPTTA